MLPTASLRFTCSDRCLVSEGLSHERLAVLYNRNRSQYRISFLKVAIILITVGRSLSAASWSVSRLLERRTVDFSSGAVFAKTSLNGAVV